jgi:hypothetical protein
MDYIYIYVKSAEQYLTINFKQCPKQIQYQEYIARFPPYKLVQSSKKVFP